MWDDEFFHHISKIYQVHVIDKRAKIWYTYLNEKKYINKNIYKY